MTPTAIVPWTWVEDGDLMRPGLSFSHSETPNGVAPAALDADVVRLLGSTPNAGARTGRNV